jgi:tetratricopeptide (TPR) repeat protein
MICIYCHADNPVNASHCLKCGAVLRSTDELPTLYGEEIDALPVNTDEQATISFSESVPRTPAGQTSRSQATPPGLRLEAGVQIGSRYRIESLLGKGGMGAVYKAHDLELDRTVALKLINPNLLNNPESIQRFKQELLLASKISHKNILRIHDLAEAGETKFISMAYIEGEDLHELLRKQRPLPLDRILGLARQLCAALEAAHSEGIVHRDLKPRNVMIDREGNAYISDFGLARSLEADAARITFSGEVLGTPQYMSPEQVQGKQVNHRSDLYSLGLIFYEMAVGVVPFSGKSLYQTMFLRTRERPKDPKLLNPEIPDFFARITMKCLEMDPARRYQNAGEILRDLEAAHGPSRKMRISLPKSGSRRMFLAAGFALILAVIALLIPGVRNQIFFPAAETKVESEGKSVPAKRTYIAVIPFRALGDQSLVYIANGIGEALSARLFHLKEVYVPSFTEAEKVGQDDSLEKIARNLGVKLIVHGTIAKTADRIAVVINLQDVENGQRLWAKKFSGLEQDLLTLEDQIYSELLNALKLTPDSEERARTATHSTENIEAYDLYLRGRNALRSLQDVESLKTAIAYFEKTLTKDAGFALAYVGLADAYLAMYIKTMDSTWAQKAAAAGEQARRLNDQLPEVYLSLGSVYTTTGKSSQAIAILNRALELAPNSDEGYRRLAAAFDNAGQKAEAIHTYQKAIEVNPYYWLNFSMLGGAYYKTGKFDDALRAYRRMTELEPDNIFGYLNIGATLFNQGKHEECIAPFKKALEIKPSWEIYSNLGTAYFYLNRYQEAVGAFEEAVKLNPSQELAYGNLADAYRWSGQPEKAMAAYDRAIALAYKELDVNPRKASAMASLALYYAKKGNSLRALDFSRRALALDGNNVEFMYGDGVVKALAGENQDAIESLRRALENGYALEDVLGNPELSSLQNLPQFKQLIADFGKSKAKDQ